MASATAPAVPDLKTLRLVNLWKIERVDGVNLLFTDHNKNLTFENEVYTPTGGFSTTAQQAQDSLRGQNAEYKGVISSGAITFEDLRAGRYRFATITARVVDWRYPWIGAFRTDVYKIRRTTFTGEAWVADVVGVSEFLRRRFGRSYGPLCRHDLGDSGCKVVLPNFTTNGVTVDTLVAGERRIHFLSRHPDFATKSNIPAQFYGLGRLTWTSGDNVGTVSEVMDASKTTTVDELDITLMSQVPNNIQIGDSYNLTAGCNRTFEVCRLTFDNLENFGAFQFIPGLIRTLQSP